MQIIFKSRNAEGSHMRDLSVERLRFALRRVIALVSRAQVQFSDVNGPRGGVDKRCRVELKTDKAGTFVVTSLAADWRTALEKSLERASRVLTRSVKRIHKPVRGRSAKLVSDGNA